MKKQIKIISGFALLVSALSLQSAAPDGHCWSYERPADQSFLTPMGVAVTGTAALAGAWLSNRGVGALREQTERNSFDLRGTTPPKRSKEDGQLVWRIRQEPTTTVFMKKRMVVQKSGRQNTISLSVN